MLISKMHNFIFVHIYKNAGTRIKNSLKPFALSQWQRIIYLLLKKAGIPSPFFNPQPYHGHIRASEIIDAIGRETFDSCFSFEVVRNPRGWQLSLYEYMLGSKSHHQHELVKQLGGFEQYVKWRCENEVRYQKDFIYSEDGELLVDFVGRYEKLDVDFEQICLRIGISAASPKLKLSRRKPYQDYYTEKTKDLVMRTFEPDVKAFGYSF